MAVRSVLAALTALTAPSVLPALAWALLGAKFGEKLVRAAAQVIEPTGPVMA